MFCGLVIQCCSQLTSDFWCVCRQLPFWLQDASSVKTFKACTNALSTFTPDWFVLENVDIETDGSDQDSNLELILSALDNAGYMCHVTNVTASDFGLPQRRARIYILGYCKRRHSPNFKRFEKNLAKCRLQCQLPDARPGSGPSVPSRSSRSNGSLV